MKEFLLNIYTQYVAAGPLGTAEDIGLPTTTAGGHRLVSILNIVFRIAALVSIIFVVIGGLKYTLSAGDPSQTKKAKDTVLYALIGLAVAVVSMGIVNFVLGSLQ